MTEPGWPFTPDAIEAIGPNKPRNAAGVVRDPYAFLAGIRLSDPADTLGNVSGYTIHLARTYAPAVTTSHGM